jgi:hypothetical protein
MMVDEAKKEEAEREEQERTRVEKEMVEQAKKDDTIQEQAEMAVEVERNKKIDEVINSSEINFEELQSILQKYQNNKDINKYIIDKYIFKLNSFFNLPTIETREENIDKLIDDLFNKLITIDDSKYTEEIKDKLYKDIIQPNNINTHSNINKELLYRIKINIIDKLYPNLILSDISVEILDKYLTYNISYFNMLSINNKIGEAIKYYENKIQNIYSKKPLTYLDNINKNNKKFYTIHKFLLDIKYKRIVYLQKSSKSGQDLINTIQEEFNKFKDLRNDLQIYINNYYEETLHNFDEKVKKFEELKEKYDNKTKQEIENIIEELNIAKNKNKRKDIQHPSEVIRINSEREETKEKLNVELKNIESNKEKLIELFKKYKDNLNNIPDIIFNNYKQDDVKDLIEEIMPLNESGTESGTESGNESGTESENETATKIAQQLNLTKNKIDQYIDKLNKKSNDELSEFDSKLAKIKELLKESEEHLKYYDNGFVSNFIKSFYKGGTGNLELNHIINDAKENEIDKEIIKDIYLNTLTIKEIDYIQILEQDGNDMTNKINEFNHELKEFKNEMKKLFENNNK